MYASDGIAEKLHSTLISIDNTSAHLDTKVLKNGCAFKLYTLVDLVDFSSSQLSKHYKEPLSEVDTSAFRKLESISTLS